MSVAGICSCPTCGREYNTKTVQRNTVRLECPNDHTWVVTDAQNIGEFYPELAT